MKKQIKESYLARCPCLPIQQCEKANSLASAYPEIRFVTVKCNIDSINDRYSETFGPVINEPLSNEIFIITNNVSPLIIANV